MKNIIHTIIHTTLIVLLFAVLIGGLIIAPEVNQAIIEMRN